jgi:hypothetical protein
MVGTDLHREGDMMDRLTAAVEMFELGLHLCNLPATKRPACGTCGGAGVVGVSNGYHGTGSNHPDACVVDLDCPDCDGTGLPLCDYCGEARAIQFVTPTDYMQVCDSPECSR